MVETIYCVHCGAVAKHPVTKVIDGQTLQFCCKGCLGVYEMMREEGLLAAPPPAEPSDSPSGPTQTLTLPVGGMTCANCVANVERSLRKVAGVQSVSVDLGAGRATLQIDPNRAAIPSLKQAIQAAGYTSP